MDQLPSTTPTRRGDLAPFCLLCHLLLSFLSKALVKGVGKAVGDVDAVTYANATDGHCGDFLTDDIFKSRHTRPSFSVADETALKQRPDSAENAFDQLALATSNRGVNSFLHTHTLPPSSIFLEKDILPRHRQSCQRPTRCDSCIRDRPSFR